MLFSATFPYLAISKILGSERETHKVFTLFRDTTANFQCSIMLKYLINIYTYKCHIFLQNVLFYDKSH